MLKLRRPHSECPPCSPRWKSIVRRRKSSLVSRPPRNRRGTVGVTANSPICIGPSRSAKSLPLPASANARPSPPHHLPYRHAVWYRPPALSLYRARGGACQSKGRNISIFLCTKLSNQKKVTLKDLRARSHRSLATLLFLPWPYARYHGFCTHQAPAPRAVIMHWS
jgi:hypothetical protein